MLRLTCQRGLSQCCAAVTEASQRFRMLSIGCNDARPGFRPERFASTTSKDDGSKEDTPQPESESAGSSSSSSDENAEAGASTQGVSEMEEQLATMKDRMLRTLADMENLRNRTSKELVDSRQYAIQGFAKDVLEIADNLERALKAVSPEIIGAEDVEKLDKQALHSNLKNLYVGVELTEKVLLNVFRKSGIERIEVASGGAFDPNLHNALFELPTSEVEAGAIAAITKTGYTLNGRVIRAADVGVARDPE